MPIMRTTIVLAVIFTVGLGHILFFEPRLKSSDERRIEATRVVNIAADDVQRIRIRRDHWTSTVIERTGTGSFRMVEPSAADIDDGLVSRLLSTVEFLKRQAVFKQTEAGAAAHSVYGLDPPELEMSMETAGGRMAHLAIGRESPGGSGIYLKVFGEDTINVVDGRLREAAHGLLEAALGN